MKLEEHKRILLIGGVVAGSVIILGLRIMVGDRLQPIKKSSRENTASVKQAINDAKTQAQTTYAQLKAVVNIKQNPAITALGEKLNQQASMPKP